ncbi:MAG: glycerol kinase GlpK [Erysipelotrichaceae bacterium]
MKKYVLAIDQGTTSTRAILFDENQNAVKTAQKEVKVYFPEVSWVVQDANEIWLSVLSVIAEIFEDGRISPDEVSSIGITNQRETAVIWNKKTGLPVSKAIVWQSRQTAGLVDKYKAMGVEPLIREKTGLILDPYFSATKIRWILDRYGYNDDLLFGTVDSWLLWKMTLGEIHATDVSNASRTLLFNIHTLEWDDELLKIFDIDRKMLPEVKDTSGLFGYIDPSIFFGTTAPITAMAGDQQAALFGESCFYSGQIKNTYGTGGFMLVNTGDRVIESKNGLLSTVAWKIHDEVKYALEGSIFVSGSLIQWLRDNLHLFEKASDTEAMAIDAGDSNGIVIVPSFTGLGAPYWVKECKGAIYGLTRGAESKHLARAALEALAYQSKDLVEVMEADTLRKVRELKVDGGASQNGFLCQFQSDILGIPVLRCEMSESTALGAARLSGLETGFYSADDFKNEKVVTFEPQMDETRRNKLYRRWKKAVESTISFKDGESE